MEPRMDAAVAVDAKNASTAPWKTAQNAVSHSAHTHRQRAPHTKFLTLPLEDLQTALKVERIRWAWWHPSQRSGAALAATACTAHVEPVHPARRVAAIPSALAGIPRADSVPGSQ